MTEKRVGIKGRKPNVNKADSASKGGMVTLRCTKEKHVAIIERAAKLHKSLNRYIADLIDVDLALAEEERVKSGVARDIAAP